MRRFSVSLLLFLASTCTFGQQVPNSVPGPEGVRPNATTIQSNVATADGCPVGLLVERRSDFAMRLAEDGHDRDLAQGLHISLIHFGPAIASVEITVYGVTTRVGALPVEIAASNEISKTFILHPGEGRKGLQEATVWMHQVGALTHVELNSMSYADGSEWHESKSSICVATPSLFLLVGAK